MNDRLRFRAWDKAISEMTYDVCIGYIKDGSIPSDWVCADTTCGQITYTGERLKDIELMQCTGLKDKNGKLIYEGDILLYPDLEEYLKTLKYAPKEQRIIIEYIGYRLMSYVPIMDEYQDLEGWTNGEDNNTPLEIIGNIYENKELLNE